MAKYTEASKHREKAMALLADGISRREVSERLGVRRATVDWWGRRHIQNGRNHTSRYDSGSLSDNPFDSDRAERGWDVSLGMDLITKPWKEFAGVIANRRI